MRIGDQPVSSATIIAGLTYTPVNKAGDTMGASIVGGVGLGFASSNFIILNSVGGIQFGSGSFGAPDSVLLRDAASVLAIRSGVNAQAFRLYNTFTDTSNYERGTSRWSANVWEFASEAAGTGTIRDLRLTAGGTTLQLSNTSGEIQMNRNGTSAQTLLRLNSTGLVSTAVDYVRLDPSINQASGSYTCLTINPTETAIGMGPHYLIRGRIGAGGNLFTVDNGGNVGTGSLTLLTSGSALISFPERTDPSAPSLNTGFLYCRDNGGGKTQLVARFPTGAVQVIATEP